MKSTLLMLKVNESFIQNNRYDRYEGSKNTSLGFNSILVGGLICEFGLIMIGF